MGKILPEDINFSFLLIGLVLYSCIANDFVAAADLKCYHCDGDSCQDPEVKVCNDAAINNQCYIRLNGNGNIIGMGCTSALGDDAAIAELIKNKELYICSTANCNGFENLPTTKECTSCTSLTDEKCATQPNMAGKKISCGVVPYTNCYERVTDTKNGTTERGCLFDLPNDEFYSCLNGQDKNCMMCNENACNSKITPPDRQQCQRCTSETDNSCEITPSALSACPLYNKIDYCVSIYESGVTHRGCGSELSCNTTERNCQICTSNGCNIANMKKRSQESYGMFQDLPLNCHTCSGAEDCATSRQRLRRCQGNIYQDCMTVFDKNGTLIASGCEDELDTEYLTHCESNVELCFNCKSNGCNNINTIPQTMDCLYCDTTTTKTCVTNILEMKTTRTCIEGCVTKLYENILKPNIYELARTCFEDLELDDRETCTKDNNCIKCDDDECNSVLLPSNDDRLSCLHCQGDICDQPLPQICSSYSQSDQCYIRFDAIKHIVAEMGCKSNLPINTILNDPIHYFVCDGNDCNTVDNLPKTHVCYNCNSVDNESCIWDPVSINNTVKCEISPHTDCYTRIINGGYTERGCINSLNNKEFLACHQGTPGELCRICTEDNCNSGVYPSSRARCYRCSSVDDPSCEKTPISKSICPLYDDNDYCVTKWDDGIIYRGCGTELKCDGNSTSKYCRICKGRFCNTDVIQVEHPIGNPGLFQDLPLNCYHCNGSTECSDNNLGKFMKCNGNIYQTCATIFDKSNGTVIARGCIDDYATSCDDDKNNCYQCKSNGCNIATTESKYINCIYCDGQKNNNCATNVTSIKSDRKCYESCVTTLYNRTIAVNDQSLVRELIRTCLDDMELDEREACIAGRDENCKVCTTDKCNTDLIGKQFSCYQCEGDECQDPVAKTCHAFSVSDQCFVRYDERSSIVELGCKSKYDEQKVKELIMAKLLWLCESENCNQIGATPTAQKCTICSSVTDENCALSPNLVKQTNTCTKTPYTQCYSRILDSGHTERGCLSSMEGEDFYECLVGSNTTKCYACLDRNCNQDIFPEGRRSCHRCSSTTDPFCESNPKSSSICLLYNPEESCTVKLVDDITYRGCSSELSCDGLDRRSCRQCSNKNNCNTDNLSNTNIGEPGKWQGLPLTCYECEGSECSNSKGVLRKCELNNLQNCQTVFDDNDLVVRRGCSDKVTATHKTYCEENPNKCLGCKSNGCNNATNLNQYIDCYKCDSNNSPDCAPKFEAKGLGVRMRKCQGKCAVALYPRSTAINPAYELERTCLDDMDLDEQEACLDGKNELCMACDKELCNTQTIPAQRHTCYHCVDKDCVNYDIAHCKAYKPNDQCYISFNNENSVVSLGCRSEFEDDVIDLLIKQKRTKFCAGEACNAPEKMPTPKVCTVCDSHDDTRCATNPNLVTKEERCSALPYTDCYTRVKEDGHTARGCLYNLEAEAFNACVNGNDSLCETCSTDKCNSLDVFPKDRWACHQCDSETNALCVSAPNSEKICPIYSKVDSCVTKYDNGVTRRGCSSSLQCENINDYFTCRICNTPACNTISLEHELSQGKPGRWQDLPITCGTCEGEDNCEGIGIYRACTGNLYQSCLTIFNANGKVIQRGCSDALEVTNYDWCQSNPNSCLRCNSNGCNNATKLTDYIDCLYCDTDMNGNNCLEVNDKTKLRKCNKYCMTALYPKSKEENPVYGLTRSCFDDMELDEREACAEDKKEKCIVCNTDKCNTQMAPSMRLSCMSCAGGDCQDPQPTTCATYRTNDQCYIKFDEHGGVNGMGCLSEFSNDEAYNLLTQKRIYTCSGDNCNTFDSIPEQQHCYICSSSTDPNCAINPPLLEVSTLCSKAPYTSCYTRILPTGVTERGCLSSLEGDEFVGCWNVSSWKTCNACIGSYCNQALFPENRLKCQTCDSVTDPKCAYKPNNVTVCPLYVEDDGCVTSYVDDITYRGCYSNIKCDTTQTKSCVRCEGGECNTINLERKQDDNHGTWQDLPLTCLTCSGDSCSQTNITSSICENNNAQDCMTVFRDDKVIARGCSDAIENEHTNYCDKNWINCPNCKSNNCNNATSLAQYIECIYCDTSKDQSCLLSPDESTHRVRSCQGHCMTALYPSDSSNEPTYELIRTCLDDKEANDQMSCINGTDANCQSCSGKHCNTAVVPNNRHSCYQCASAKCEEPISHKCSLYKSKDQCFTTFDDSNTIVEMGCVSSFRNQLLETIIGTKHIKLCDSVDCNSLDSTNTLVAHKCAICDSRNDSTCATNGAEVGTFNTCSQYPYTECYTKVINNDGSTIRGCLTDLPTTDFVDCVLSKDTNCSICIGDGCNREIFPADRQQCYTCSSDDDIDCESNPARLLACPYITQTEKCRTAYDGNVTVRGCSSEVLCDLNDRNSCRECSGNACNIIDLANPYKDDGNHGIWQSLPLRCHTCEGEHCTHSLGPAYNCTGNVEQDCATVFTTDGKVKRRGCVNDVEDYEQKYCRQNPHLCFACKSNECNDAWSINEYIKCDYCTSATDDSCAVDPVNGKFKKRSCKQECMVAIKDSQVIRTCLDDKEEQSRYVCHNDLDGSECSSCNTTDCNNFIYPKDRLSCHICTDESCSTSNAQLCSKYVKNDFCFVKYENDKIQLTGCGSSQESYNLVEWEKQKKIVQMQ